MWLTSKVEKGPPICWVKLSSTFHFQACFSVSEKMDFKLWAIQSGYSQQELAKYLQLTILMRMARSTVQHHTKVPSGGGYIISK